MDSGKCEKTEISYFCDAGTIIVFGVNRPKQEVVQAV